LTGVLTEKLLNIQYKERGSKPFYSRLNGLKLNKNIVKRIYTEAINKLNEYNKNYYKELEYLIGMYMLSEESKRMFPMMKSVLFCAWNVIGKVL